jgi:hypothetical protein
MEYIEGGEGGEQEGPSDDVLISSLVRSHCRLETVAGEQDCRRRGRGCRVMEPPAIRSPGLQGRCQERRGEETCMWRLLAARLE